MKTSWDYPFKAQESGTDIIQNPKDPPFFYQYQYLLLQYNFRDLRFPVNALM
jgi:hypothetical protein